MKCSQCDRQAMYEIQGHLLCLEHRTMLVSSLQQSSAESAAMINYLRDSIDAVFGLPPQGPRIEIPQPVIQNAPVTLNNIKVDRSIVGSINTAQVSRIDVAMENLRNGGEEEVTKAIGALTEAVIKVTQADEEVRNQLIEQLAFLAEQAVLPEQQRQRSVIKIVLGAVSKTIPTITGLTTLWAQWGPVLEHFFQHAIGK